MTTTAIPPIDTDAPTASDQWTDANVRHVIGLLMVSDGLRERLWRTLDATEPELRHEILDRLRRVRGLQSASDVRRVKRLIERLRAIRSRAWEDVSKHWREQAVDVALSEPGTVARMLRTVLPVAVVLALPARAALRGLVGSGEIRGRTLAAWIRDLRAADLKRIEDQIRIAVSAGEPSEVAARRVVGTTRARGIDGATQTTRRHVGGLVHTSVIFVSQAARSLFFGENKALLLQELYVAVLDGRTTPICRSLSGNVYAIGVGPHPPVHFRCRSHRVPFLNGDAMTSVPTKPFTEQLLLGEFAAQQGFTARPRSRAAIPRGFRGKYDAFRRRRIRELVGTASAELSYAEFLRRQSAAFQDEVLGKARGKLFRSGELELRKFVNARGRQIPLSDLARFHADAFRAAGLDPSEFTI